VTQDESHVSVVDLLALHQLLRKPGSNLANFWTSTHWSKKEHPGGAEIVDLTHCLGLCGPSKGSCRVL
jgi:hypothetical protein